MICGVILGLAMSSVEFLNGRNPYLEYKSIPNLNRSAIYHVIALFVMLGIIMDSRLIFSRKMRFFAGGCFFISVISLIIMGSRGAILGFISGILVLVISMARSRKASLSLLAYLAAAIVAVVTITMVWDNSAIGRRMKKFSRYYDKLKETGELSSLISSSEHVRWDYAQLAWAQITQTGHVLLGTGPSTYSHIDVKKLKFKKRLKIFNNKSWEGPSHAHNEYLTRWVEVGLLGLGAYLVFLFFIAVSLYRHRNKEGAFHWQWIASSGFIATAFVSGMFNTVFTNEMGWLSIIIVGIYLGGVRKKESSLVQYR
jgi:O-antigen ligase